MKEKILAFAIENALEHEGRAAIGPVMGKMMAKHPELRKDPKSLSMKVKEAVEEVNSMDREEMLRALDAVGGPIEMKKRERKDPLVPLKGADEGMVRMRFAPGPSGPLHIGHTRAAVLNDEYCRRYDGKFLLRLEDTNPEKIDPDAYRMIPEDLDWLGIKVDETHVQSDRFEIYYDITENLIAKGNAYVCTMDLEKWRDLKARSVPCKERDQHPDSQMERWDLMKEGAYDEGEASVVIKTDIDHKNPAVRDFVGMRIRHSPHPRTKDRYHIYPLYNLSVAIDDHLMDCTHILRGKDHLNNTFRQRYVYEHMGWEEPVFTHYGLVSIPRTILKTSLIKDEIALGNYSGWDDIRLGTVRALAKRGFDPDSIRRYWKETGVKEVDITFSWETMETMNREIIDPCSERYFFVEKPKPLSIESDAAIKGIAPKHPQKPDLGQRTYSLEPDKGKIKVMIPSKEVKDLKEGDIIRLKDLINIKIKNGGSRGKITPGDARDLRSDKGRIIQWAKPDSPDCRIYSNDGGVMEGIAEQGALSAAKQGKVVQFERVGFCRLEMDHIMIGYYTHK